MATSRIHAFDDAAKRRYLDTLLETGEKALARQAVPIARQTIAGHRKHDPKFREDEDEALRIYRANLAKEVHRRAVQGVQEPVIWQGTTVGWKTIYSDRLLELQIKRHYKDYTDRVALKTDGSSSLTTEQQLMSLPPEKRAIVLEAMRILGGSNDKGTEAE